MASAEAAESRRIVLLGKTGSGKSSLANTILGEGNLFEVFHGSVSGTKLCKSETREVFGKAVQLIDTPGLFDTDPNSPDIKKEVLNCLIESASGVHAFLLVLKIERFTKHEQSVYDLFCKEFSADALKYTTVVFTQGDQLEEGTTLKEWIKENEVLSKLVENCGGRCHVFDNKYWKNSQDQYRNNQVHLEELFKTINQTVEENRGRCYTNTNFEAVEEHLNKEIQAIKADPENAKMSEEEVKKKAKENTFNYFWKILPVALGVGALIGTALLKS